MPQLDGALFLKRLRQFDAEQPVIILTSDSDQLLEAELAMLGANAFVRKDDDLRVLLAWCHSLWQRAEKRDREFPGGPDYL